MRFPRARASAEATLAVHVSLPPGDRSPTQEAITRCDLGIALAGLGSPDGALEQGRSALASSRIVERVLSRAGDLDAFLTARYPGLPEARDFHEQYRGTARNAALRTV